MRVWVVCRCMCGGRVGNVFGGGVCVWCVCVCVWCVCVCVVEEWGMQLFVTKVVRSREKRGILMTVFNCFYSFFPAHPKSMPPPSHIPPPSLVMKLTSILKGFSSLQRRRSSPGPTLPETLLQGSRRGRRTRTKEGKPAKSEKLKHVL